MATQPDETKPDENQPEDPKVKPDETTSTAKPDEAPPGDKPAEDNPADEPSDDAPEDPPENSSAEQKDEEEDMPKEACSTEKLQKFVSKFGAEHGAAWAIEGITYTKALERHCDALTIELTDANTRLKALGQTGTKPFKFSHGNDGKSKPGTSTQTPEKLNEVCGEGVGRIAAAIKLPTSK